MGTILNCLSGSDVKKSNFTRENLDCEMKSEVFIEFFDENSMGVFPCLAIC